MTDDIQVGLLYILGHIHAPTPEQTLMLPCGLPSMPSRKAIQKLHTIALACDWIHDQIEKSIAAEEEQVQKAQESLPFVEAESTSEENGFEQHLDALAASLAAALEPITDKNVTPPIIKVPQVVKRRSRVSQPRKSVYVKDRHYGRVVFKTLSHAARAYNLNAEAVRSRVKRGWTVEQALEIDVVPRGVTVADARGPCIYKNLAAACRANAVSYASVQARIKKGESPSDAICALRTPLPRVRL